MGQQVAKCGEVFNCASCKDSAEENYFKGYKDGQMNAVAMKKSLEDHVHRPTNIAECFDPRFVGTARLADPMTERDKAFDCRLQVPVAELIDINGDGDVAYTEMFDAIFMQRGDKEHQQHAARVHEEHERRLAKLPNANHWQNHWETDFINHSGMDDIILPPRAVAHHDEVHLRGVWTEEDMDTPHGPYGQPVVERPVERENTEETHWSEKVGFKEPATSHAHMGLFHGHTAAYVPGKNKRDPKFLGKNQMEEMSRLLPPNEWSDLVMESNMKHVYHVDQKEDDVDVMDALQGIGDELGSAFGSGVSGRSTSPSRSRSPSPGGAKRRGRFGLFGSS